MYVKTVTYTDYNGVERTEDCYFNLNEAELMELEFGKAGGYSEMVQKIIKAKDNPTIMSLFKTLLLKSYGVKSDDGRRFIKSKELSEEFSQTEAYSQLFMELGTNAQAAADFVKGVIPQKYTNNENFAKEFDALTKSNA